MIVNFIYNSLESNFDPLKIPFEECEIDDLTINYFDLSYTKEKKKGWAILNKYVARELPAFEITDDDKNLLHFSYAESRIEKLTPEYVIRKIKEFV